MSKKIHILCSLSNPNVLDKSKSDILNKKTDWISMNVKTIYESMIEEGETVEVNCDVEFGFVNEVEITTENIDEEKKEQIKMHSFNSFHTAMVRGVF